MSMRVLVADDEATIRGVILQVLEEDGMEVVEAASAEEALERFRAEPFPLVITDIYMGRMTGLDLLKQIKEAQSDAMVVVMTSNASLETAMSALRRGAYDYLIKPFEDIDMVSAVVRRAIDRYQLDGRNRMLVEDLKRNTEELERMNVRLTDMANRDGLTGLYNHRFFREALELEIARCHRHGRQFAVIFMDIDHFKHYNDSYGHLAGDSVLCLLAKLLQERSRGETVVARYGGEEFVLLVPEITSDGARCYADSLRQAVASHPFSGEETQPLGKITLSLGVACYPEAGDEPALLIGRADKALYSSKRAGRNVVSIWNPSLG
jgi:diguanylate cyclase (GGDEF)-like protein